MHKLVLDSNVLISGFLWDGNEAALIREIEKGKARCFITEEIIIELESVLKREKFSKIFKLANTTPEAVLVKVKSISTLVKASKLEEQVVKKDPTDDKFIACALSVNAELIVSGDANLLEIKNYEGVRIINAVKALRVLRD